MKFVADTNIGKIRKNNEDDYYIPNNNKNLFIVADGMGGHLAGETASKTAVNIISNIINKSDMNSLKEIEKNIKLAINTANEKIYEISMNNPKCNGMGTTLSLAYFWNNNIIFANIGDSRIYKINNDEIIQMTDDDSYVNCLLQLGEITKLEAENHPKKNILTKALGINKTTTIDINTETIQSNTKFLICSDGLTNMISENKIKKIINNNSLDDALNELLELSLLNGGMDNITLILISF